MPPVRYSKPATRDIAGIGAKFNKPVSETFVASMKEKCRTIASAPLMGREREDYGAGIRSFHFGSYVIFYQPENVGIIIVRVIHGMRNFPEVFHSDE